MPLRKKPFENIVGKGENAGNQHFLLFPHNAFYLLVGKFDVLSNVCLLQKQYTVKPVLETTWIRDHLL